MSGPAGNTSSARAVAFYCPYCGDEDLRPDAADGAALPHGAWRCAACQQAFSLKKLTNTPERTDEVIR
jgi:transposase-like protein